MILSILICTIPEPFRNSEYSTNLIKSLTVQANRKPVQVLYLGDNKSMTVGEKRNALIQISKGERVIFVDDDDQVYTDYIDTLLEYCKLPYDCVSIGVRMTENDINEKIYDYTYKQNINRRENGLAIAGRIPNHLCLWKREIAMRVTFPHKNLGEDHEWAERQLLLGYSFFDTKKIIYHYDFKRNVTQTRA